MQQKVAKNERVTSGEDGVNSWAKSVSRGERMGERSRQEVIFWLGQGVIRKLFVYLRCYG
jgi:hypothetical protein